MASSSRDSLLHLLSLVAVVVLVTAGTTTPPPTAPAVTTAAPAAVTDAEAEAEVVPEQHEGKEPISCYICNSFEDGDKCLDPLDEDKLSSLTQMECNATLGQFACFKVKTTTYEYATSARPESTSVVTTRMCASDEGGEDTWWQDSGSGSGVEHARCLNSLCNSGHRLATSILICLASTILGACAILGMGI